MVPGSGLPRLAKDLRRPGCQDEVAASARIRVFPYTVPIHRREPAGSPGPAAGPCRPVRTPSCNGKLPGCRRVLLRIKITCRPSGDSSPS